jgi:hypothetical protein
MRIKIERIAGATATVIRNNHRTKVWLGMTLTDAEFATLEVTEGSILYTVDEQSIHTIEAPKQEAVQEKPVAVPTKKKTKVILDNYKTDLE